MGLFAHDEWNSRLKQRSSIAASRARHVGPPQRGFKAKTSEARPEAKFDSLRSRRARKMPAL
jgi:hypothetical protein